MLGGNHLFQICLIAAAACWTGLLDGPAGRACWAGLLLIMLRRRAAPTRPVVALWKYGFLLALSAILAASTLIGALVLAAGS